MWGSWDVGSCSKSCGGGKKTKTRRKTVTEKYNGKCEGSSNLEENCNEQHCPSKSTNLKVKYFYLEELTNVVISMPMRDTSLFIS